MIDVTGFCKSYDDRLAVDGLTFAVRPGEIVGLVGPNGAGKTTTLRAIAGIIAPTRGRLGVAGFDIAQQPLEAKQRLAIIFDEPQLFGSLTVWEHVEFTARVYGVDDYRARAEDLLGRFELLDRRHSLADELSKGMKQKVAVTCGLLHEPLALLLDEPLTGLDPRAIRTLYELLHERAAVGAAVIISSHLLDQIAKLCTGFLILREGRLVLGGTRAELTARLPSLQADASLEEIFFQATEGATEAVAEPAKS